MDTIGVDIELAIVAACTPGERFVHRLVCRAWSLSPPLRPTVRGVTRSIERLEWARSVGIEVPNDGGAVGRAAVRTAARSGDWRFVDALLKETKGGSYHTDDETSVLLRWTGRGHLARTAPCFDAFMAGRPCNVAPPGDHPAAHHAAIVALVVDPVDGGSRIDVTWRGDELSRVGNEWIARWEINRAYDAIGRFRSTARTITLELAQWPLCTRIPAEDLVVPIDALWKTRVTVEMRFDAPPQGWAITATCWMLRGYPSCPMDNIPMALGPLLVRGGDVLVDVREVWQSADQCDHDPRWRCGGRRPRHAAS